MSRLLSLIVFGHVLAVAHAEPWPGWRGQRGDGISSETNVPLVWSETENIRWKLPLSGPGNSSPIVWGDRVFLTQSLDKKGHKRAIFCIDRAKGTIRWQREVEYSEDEPSAYHQPCSATPVTDGERVIACFGSAGLTCWDME